MARGSETNVYTRPHCSALQWTRLFCTTLYQTSALQWTRLFFRPCICPLQACSPPGMAPPGPGCTLVQRSSIHCLVLFTIWYIIVHYVTLFTMWYSMLHCTECCSIELLELICLIYFPLFTGLHCSLCRVSKYPEMFKCNTLKNTLKSLKCEATYFATHLTLVNCLGGGDQLGRGAPQHPSLEVSFSWRVQPALPPSLDVHSGHFALFQCFLSSLGIQNIKFCHSGKDNITDMQGWDIL